MRSNRPFGTSVFPNIKSPRPPRGRQWSASRKAALTSAITGWALLSGEWTHAQTLSVFDPQNYGQTIYNGDSIDPTAPNDPTEWGQSVQYATYDPGHPDQSVYQTAYSNWTTPNYPNGDYDVLIGAFTVELQVPGTTTVDTLDLEAGSLTVDNNNGGGFGGPYATTLDISGNSFVNNGTLTLSGGIANTALTFDSNSTATISGTGGISLSDGQLVTLGTTALINNQLGGITGFGIISANMTNDTVVNANSAGNTIQLVTSDDSLGLTNSNPSFTNSGTLEASNGGVLVLGVQNGHGGDPALTIANSAGTLNANGGTIDFYGNVTINGGTLSSSGTGGFSNIAGLTTLNGVTLTTGTSFTNTGYYSNLLQLEGTITNNGTFYGLAGPSGTAYFLPVGTVTLAGTGAINLQGASLDTASGNTITVGSSQTINGPGTISAAMTNNGTIDATYNTLFILATDPSGGAPATNNPTFINNGTLEAVGGTLQFGGYQGGASLTINNTNGTISASGGGTISFYGANIVNGGTLSSSGTSGFSNTAGPTTLNGVTLTAGTSFTCTGYYGSTLQLQGAVTNNGTIYGLQGPSGTAFILPIGTVTLAGTGSISLQSANLDTTAGNTISIGAAQSIYGPGTISATMTNNGTIDAPYNTLYIASTDPTGGAPATSNPIITNPGTLEATGGTLQIGEYAGGGSLTINNTGGTITANGGTVNFQSTLTINGGTLSSTGTFANAIQNIGGTTTLNGVTLPAGTNFTNSSGSVVNLQGTVTNNGTLWGQTNLGTPAYFLTIGDATLAGTGSLLLQGASLDTSGTNTITVGPSQSIYGPGRISAALTNYGTISMGYNTLVFSPTDPNLGTLSASNPAFTNAGTISAPAGTIQFGDFNAIGSLTINNSTGNIIADGGNVTFENTVTINGGTLTSTAASGTTAFQTVGSTTTLNGVTLTAGTNFTNNAGNVVNLEGTVVNNGTLWGQTSFGTPAFFLTTGSASLAGTGVVQLQGGSMDTTAGNTISVGSAQTIYGPGTISATMTNNGIIDASYAQLSIVTTDPNGSAPTTNNPTFTNNGTLEATAGTLQIGEYNAGGTLTINNSSGTITANGGTVAFQSTVTINGGTLTSTAGSGTAAFENIGGTTTLNGVTLTAGSSFTNTNQNSALQFQGTVTNNGTIYGEGNYFSNNYMLSVGNATLAGNGAVSLQGQSFDTTGTNTITVGASQSIYGPGLISAAMTNYGTIANGYNNLYISTSDSNNPSLGTNNPTFTNAGTIEATAGGPIQFGLAGGPLTVNNAGGTITANGGTVNFQGTVTINGGTLTSTAGSGTAAFENIGGTTTLNGVTLTAGSSFTNTNQNSALQFQGTVTNNGTIYGEGNYFSNNYMLSVGNATLAGNGAVSLQGQSFDTTGTNTITVGASQSIYGPGLISAAMTNYGTIANGYNTLYISTADSNNPSLGTNNPTFTNAGTIEATAGGAIQFGLAGGPLTVNNAGGTITANGGNVFFAGGVTVNGGTLTSTGTSEFSENYYNTLNNVTLTTGTYFDASSGLDLEGTITNNGSISNSSTVTILGDTNLNGTGYLLLTSANLNATPSTATLTQGTGHAIYGRGTIDASIINAGTIEVVYGNGSTLNLNGASYTNNGYFVASDNTTLNMAGGSVLTNYSAATSTLTGGYYQALSAGNGATLSLNIGSIITNAADVTLSGSNSIFTPINSLANNQGGFHILNGQTFSTSAGLNNSGTVEIGAPGVSPVTSASVLTVPGDYTQTAGKTIVNGQLNITSGSLSLNGGTLQGSGTISGMVTNSAGTVSPGNSPGLLSVVGTYTQSSGAALDIEIGGTTPGTLYDQLAVTGNTSLGGTLAVTLIDGFSPTSGQTFTILTANQVTGTFSTTEIPAGTELIYTSDSVEIAVPEPATTSLLTIAAVGILAKRRRRPVSSP